MKKLEPDQVTAVLLAAGKGTRMRPLTNSTAKPLLQVGECRLIEYHIYKLAKIGIRKIVINIAFFPEQFYAVLGDGSAYGVSIVYSDESQSGALETAGGIVNALPLIDSTWFLTINADVWTDIDFSMLLSNPPSHAKLMLVDNPEHNPNGDFFLRSNGLLSNSREGRLTFSGISIFHRQTFTNLTPGKRALGPFLKELIDQELVEGVRLNGQWYDIGTPARLEELESKLQIN